MSANPAWVDVCVDAEASRRWVSIDVTHNCMIDQRHVRLGLALSRLALSYREVTILGL
ncbi:hypothetical protein [Polaromonas sp. SM01]|uniref:hypothetical protein n=1 Tax=Polaromonas sp. SM01 TaxID=3085630 RepID=UPI0029810CDA|nr:hypothetical protein [Polaromonas sp. SM01]MDW5444223.1 hypothetical protein [Polaromonas sp. SM01]